MQTIDTARRDPQLVARILRAALADVLTYSGDPAAVDARIAAAGLDVGLTIDADAIAVTAHAPHGKFAWGGHCGNRVLVGPGYRISLGHVVQSGESLSGVYQLCEDPAGVEVAHWDDVEHPVTGFDEDAPCYEVQWWLEPGAHTPSRRARARRPGPPDPGPRSCLRRSRTRQGPPDRTRLSNGPGLGSRFRKESRGQAHLGQ